MAIGWRARVGFRLEVALSRMALRHPMLSTYILGRGIPGLRRTLGKTPGIGEMFHFNSGGISAGRLNEIKKELLIKEISLRKRVHVESVQGSVVKKAITTEDVEWFKKAITAIKEKGLIQKAVQAMKDPEHIRAAIPGMEPSLIAAVIPILQLWQLEIAVPLMNKEQTWAAILAMKEAWQIRVAVPAMKPEQLKAAIPIMDNWQIEQAVSIMSPEQIKTAIPAMNPQQTRVAILAMNDRWQIAEVFPLMDLEQMKAALLVMDRQQVEVAVRNLEIDSDSSTISMIARALSSPEIAEDQSIGIIRMIKSANPKIIWAILKQIEPVRQRSEEIK